ncbi:hypothetical protein MMPV_005804 [Pyropia vietnamensis]
MEEPPPPLPPPPPPPPPSTSPTTVTTAPFPPPPVAPPVAVTAWLTAATDAAARSCAAAGHVPCAGSTPWGGPRGVCDSGGGGCTAATAGSSSDSSPPTPFHGVAPPGVGVEAYVERLGEYGGVAPETWVLAVAYLSRATRWGVDGRRVGGALTPPPSRCRAGPEPPPAGQVPTTGLAPAVPLNGLTVHRLVLAALLLAAKTHEDAHLSNGGWAVVGGVGVTELNRLELGLLHGLSYATAVRAAEYETVRRALGLCAPRGMEKEGGSGEWRHDLPAPAAPAPAAPPVATLCWTPAVDGARPASPAAAAAPPPWPPRPPSPAGGWSPAPAVWSPAPVAACGLSPASWAAAATRPATPPPGALPGWGLPATAVAGGAGGPIHSHAPPQGAYACGRAPRSMTIPAVSAVAAAVAAAGGSAAAVAAATAAAAASTTVVAGGRPPSRGWPGGRGSGSSGRRRPPLPPSWSAAHRQRPPRCGRTSPAFRKPGGGESAAPVL